MVFSLTNPRLLQYYLLQVQCKFLKNDLFSCPEVTQPDNSIYSQMSKSTFAYRYQKWHLYPYITVLKIFLSPRPSHAYIHKVSCKEMPLEKHL